MILCVGCSWTYGYGLDIHETYPAYLEKITGKKVLNAGMNGSDIQYAIYSAYRLLQEHDISLIVFQLTTLDRKSIPVSGYDNFVSGKYYDKNKVKNTLIQNESRAQFGDIEFELITQSSYLEAVKSKKTERDLAIKYTIG